mgnify:CR=1 FL=1
MGLVNYTEMDGKQFARILAYLESSENLNDVYGVEAYNVTLMKIGKIYPTFNTERRFLRIGHTLKDIVLGFHNPESRSRDMERISILLKG